MSKSPLTSFEMLESLLTKLKEQETCEDVSKQDVINVSRQYIYNVILALVMHPFRHNMALPFTPS